MAVIGWSVRGRRVEYRTAAFNSAQFTCDGQPAENPLWLDGHEYVLRMKRGVSDTPVELVTPGGDELPPTHGLVTPQRAPDGALCGTHPEVAAAIACPRCGGFFCGAGCAHADGTHCVSCARLLVEARRKQFSSFWYFLPCFVLLLVGSFVGLCTGLIAALIAIAIARRTESFGVRLAATVSLYALATAAAVWFGYAILWG